MTSTTSKPTIALVELDYHADLLEQLIQLIDNDRFYVYCIITPHVFDLLSPKVNRKFEFFILRKINDLKTFLSDKNIDLFLFNTCASHFYTWSSIIQNTKSLLRIHNINTYFLPLKNILIPKDFRSTKKFIAHIVLQQIFQLYHVNLRKLLKRISFFSFMSKSTQDYFEKNCPELSHKIAPILPLAFHDYLMFENNKEVYKKTDVIRIVITGTIEPKRKDFDAIEKIVSFVANQTKYFIEITFAGKTPSHSIQFAKKLKQKENKYFRFQYFNNYLSAEEYHKICSNAHIIFFPIAKQSSFKIFKENYGYSKISGSEKDLIVYGKFCILPSWYPIDKELERLVHKYDSYDNQSIANTTKFLLNYLASDYSSIVQTIYAHYETYNFNTMKNIVNQILKKIVDCE